jgi:branched-chain amino acid aminotransferase
MKAFKDDKGNVRAFRPECNMKRMKFSCNNIALPVILLLYIVVYNDVIFKDFDGDEFLACIKELLRIDSAWVPKVRGFSLYIRPTAISMEV